jgi:hypothetical protein
MPKENTNKAQRTPSDALLKFLEHHSLTLEELLERDDDTIYAMVGCTVQLLLEIRSFR